MKFVTPEIAARLRAVADAIAIHPDSFDMSNWFGVNDCGTVLCIAGHYNLLRNYTPVSVDTRWRQEFQDKSDSSSEPLFGPSLFVRDCGLPYTDSIEPYMWLFYMSKWPSDLIDMYAEDRALAGRFAIELYIREFATDEVAADLPPLRKHVEAEKVTSGSQS